MGTVLPWSTAYSLGLSHIFHNIKPPTAQTSNCLTVQRSHAHPSLLCGHGRSAWPYNGYCLPVNAQDAPSLVSSCNSIFPALSPIWAAFSHLRSPQILARGSSCDHRGSNGVAAFVAAGTRKEFRPLDLFAASGLDFASAVVPFPWVQWGVPKAPHMTATVDLRLLAGGAGRGHSRAEQPPGGTGRRRSTTRTAGGCVEAKVRGGRVGVSCCLLFLRSVFCHM